MKNEFITKAGRRLSMASFTLKKHSPEIMMVAGVVGVITSAVLACRATLKVHDILDEAKENVDTIHECKNNDALSAEYTEEDSNKDLFIVYCQTAWGLTKLYAPSILLGAASITSIFMSNGILRKRNAQLVAAYAVLDRSFKQYRERLKEKYGDKADYELFHNIKAETIKKIVTDENGNEHEEEETVAKTTDNNDSGFSVLFDPSNPNWTKDPNHNLYFLKSQQAWANDQLQRKGYLFLNDVYRALGYKEIAAGQIVGWLYRPNDEKYAGDSYIDFGIFNMQDEAIRRFLNGDENCLWLDFNIDGTMYDKINTVKGVCW